MSQSSKDELSFSTDLIKFGKDCTIGATAAVIAKTIIAPIERVKLILQLQTSQNTISVQSRYTGMVDCLLRLPKEQGFISFWRGNFSNVLRAASQESLGMAFKEFYQKHLTHGIDSQKQYELFFAANLTAGGLAGSTTFLFIYPLDFSRTRLAVDMGKDAASREFRGLVHCFYKISKHDGILGLYRGFLPSVTYIFIFRAIYYGLFDSLKVLTKRPDGNISFLSALCIGQFATTMAALVSYPLDTVRRRLMMQSGKTTPEYNGTWDCTKALYRAEGVPAFFKGFFVNAIRGFGAAMVLAIYNDLSKLF